MVRVPLSCKTRKCESARAVNLGGAGKSLNEPYRVSMGKDIVPIGAHRGRDRPRGRHTIYEEDDQALS